MNISLKGQVGLYLLLGIIIILALFGTWYIGYYDKRIADDEIDSEYTADFTMPVMEFVNICFSDTIIEAVENISFHGGYYNISSQLAVGDTAYWYVNGRNQAPFISEVEEALEAYFNDHVYNCLQYGSLEMQNFKIQEHSVPEPDILLTDFSIKATVKYSVDIEKSGESLVESEYFYVEVPIDFKKVLLSGYDIVNKGYHPSFSMCEPLNCSNATEIELGYNKIPHSVLVTITSRSGAQQGGLYNYSLRFYISKRLNESYGDSPLKKRTLVVTQKACGYYMFTPTFADAALATLEAVILGGYDEIVKENCVMNQLIGRDIDDYDILLNLGGTDFAIVMQTLGIPIFGCVPFKDNPSMDIDRWIEEGNLAFLSGWQRYDSGGDPDLELPESLRSYLLFPYDYQDRYEVHLFTWPIDIMLKEILPGEHLAPTVADENSSILHCPNEITAQLAQAYVYSVPGKNPLEWDEAFTGALAGEPHVIMGRDDFMALRHDTWGDGIVLMDGYIMKQNLFGAALGASDFDSSVNSMSQAVDDADLPEGTLVALPTEEAMTNTWMPALSGINITNDLLSLGIAEAYYENALHYLLSLASEAKHDIKGLLSSYCKEPIDCNLVCCEDESGYNYTNYHKDNCLSKGGKVHTLCEIDVFCQ